MEAYNNRGLLYLQRDQLKEARADFEMAVQQRPEYAAAHYNLGLTLMKSGEREAAQVQFDAAKRLEVRE